MGKKQKKFNLRKSIILGIALALGITASAFADTPLFLCMRNILNYTLYIIIVFVFSFNFYSDYSPLCLLRCNVNVLISER